MTDKLYVGSQVDCNTIRAAQDYVLDLPQPPLAGQHAVNAATKAARRAAWFAMTPANREAIIANPDNTDYEGWELQFSGLYFEYEPGVRCGVFIPSDIASRVTAASVAGRSLSIDQALVLTAAQATWINDFPANWVTPPP